MEKYSLLVRDYNPKLHKKLTKLIDKIPDQRIFNSEAAIQSLKPWTPHRTWKYLYLELETLKYSAERGDQYDNEIYYILTQLGDYDITPKLLHSNIDTIEFKTYNVEFGSSLGPDNFQYHITNFMITYPTLSYFWIIKNNLYNLGVAANHTAVIKLISTPGAWSSAKMCCYVPANRNGNSVRVLLTALTLVEVYDKLITNAALYRNKLCIEIVWALLNDEQRKKKVIVNALLDMSMVDLFSQIYPKGNVVDEIILEEIIRVDSVDILDYIFRNCNFGEDLFKIYELAFNLRSLKCMGYILLFKRLLSIVDISFKDLWIIKVSEHDLMGLLGFDSEIMARLVLLNTEYEVEMPAINKTNEGRVINGFKYCISFIKEFKEEPMSILEVAKKLPTVLGYRRANEE